MNAPLTVLIGALGGEGGGVLAGWLVAAARASGYPVQATSIPGVAQRTGATTYYIEIFPVKREALGSREVVLALSPVPGRVDLMVCSELLEAGRAVQNGTVSPERTTLIASTHRTYTVAEKAAMSDGRFDTTRLRAALERFSQRAVLFDMESAARASGTVISAVMLGAIAGSGRLPMARAAFEEAIRGAGRNAGASLAGFAAGFAAAGGAPPTAPRGTEATEPAGTSVESQRMAARFAPAVRAIVAQGYARQADYQDRAYAERYLGRVERVYCAESGAGATLEFPVTDAYARFLALWMSYEDVVRVADLKTRGARHRRVREEAAAGADDLVRVIEYFKPTVEEWCAVLTPRLAARLRAWAGRNNRAQRFFGVGLHLKTTSLHGFLMLRTVAAFRWWRPRTSRFAEEQALIERWTGAVLEALARDRALAHEIARCGRRFKGYGDTHARGKANFLRILDTLVAGGAADVDAIRGAREAALADPEGNALEQSLARQGVAPLPPRARPITWHKPRRAAGAMPSARSAPADAAAAVSRAAKD